MSKTATPKPVKKQKQQDLAIVAPSLRSLERSGPLPQASEMAQYEKICSDADERIIIMAEKQSEHRQKIEYAVVRVSIKDLRRNLNEAKIPFNERKSNGKRFFTCITLNNPSTFSID